jgi:hypothetical protein
MPWRRGPPPACTDGSIAHPEQDVFCRPVPHADKTPTADMIAVYHYVTRSRQDFELKHKKGGGDGMVRSWDYFNKVQRCASPVSIFFKKLETGA